MPLEWDLAKKRWACPVREEAMNKAIVLLWYKLVDPCYKWIWYWENHKQPCHIQNENQF